MRAVVLVRDAVDGDLGAITDIHNALMATTSIEWRDEPHTVAERAEWLGRQRDAGHPVLVAEQQGEVVGWTTYSDFRDTTRWPGYRYTVELTIHVAQSAWRGGVGRALLDELMARARAAGKHVIVAGVDGENDASLRFHERLGFVEVARMPEVGAKFGRWLDLVLLQRMLDDRPAPPADPGVLER